MGENLNGGEGRPKRPKINYSERKGVSAIIDTIEFINNKCSKNALKVGNIESTTCVDYWIDKHYHIRYQQGDEYGKREGIEPEKVYALIERCIPHLQAYSGFVERFAYLNNDSVPRYGRNVRVVCQKIFEDNQLNVTIEGHLVALNEIEITIITAIQKNDFIPSDGQYTILIDDNNGSELFYCSKGRVGLAASI